MESPYPSRFFLWSPFELAVSDSVFPGSRKNAVGVILNFVHLSHLKQLVFQDHQHFAHCYIFISFLCYISCQFFSQFSHIYIIYTYTHTYIYIHTYTNHSRSKSSPSQNVQTVQNPFQWGFLTCPYSNSPNVPFTSVRSRPIWPRCHWWQGCHTHRRARYGVGGYSLVTQVQWNGSNKDQLLEYNWNNGIIVLGINYYWSGISYNGIIIANSKDYSSNMS